MDTVEQVLEPAASVEDRNGPDRQSGELDGSELSQYLQHLNHHFDSIPGPNLYYTQLKQFLRLGGRAGLQSLKCVELGGLKEKGTDFRSTIRPVDFESRSRDLRVCVLEGFPSPNCLAALARRHKIRPEIFIGHLELGQWQNQNRRWYTLPTVPSRRENIVHIRLISLGQFTGAQGDSRRPSPAVKREMVNEDTVRYQQRLFDQRRFGETRYRKVHIHTSENFSVEQMITFCASRPDVRERAPWIVTFLLDRGRNVEQDRRLPWQAADREGDDSYELVHAVDYNACGVDRKIFQRLEELKLAPAMGHHVYHPIADIASVAPSDFHLLHTDPFFLLSRVLVSAAMSWTQVLNFMEEDISKCHNAPAVQSPEALEQLQFNISLLDRFRGFLHVDLDVISNRGWIPECNSSPRLQKLQFEMRNDYEYLLDRVDTLLKRCEVSSGVLVSTIGVLESQKSIAQSERVNQLTALAFIYIPASFVAGVFGMNVKELSADPPIWTFFATAIPFTILSLLVASSFSQKPSHGFPLLRSNSQPIVKSPRVPLADV